MVLTAATGVRPRAVIRMILHVLHNLGLDAMISAFVICLLGRINLDLL